MEWELIIIGAILVKGRFSEIIFLQIGFEMLWAKYVPGMCIIFYVTQEQSTDEVVTIFSKSKYFQYLKSFFQINWLLNRLTIWIAKSKIVFNDRLQICDPILSSNIKDHFTDRSMIVYFVGFEGKGSVFNMHYTFLYFH